MSCTPSGSSASSGELTFHCLCPPPTLLIHREFCSKIFNFSVSSDQINAFVPLHSIEFNEELLERHEQEVAKMKGYFEENKELFTKVSQRQQVWGQFMELERRKKDPARLVGIQHDLLRLN